MARDTVNGQKEYDLQEAARLLNKSEAALRMQIRRESIRAIKRPLDDTGRYKYYIPASEIEKEKRRLEAATHRSEARRSSASATTAFAGRRPPSPSSQEEGDAIELVRAVIARQEQLERELREEREDTRALIRSLEQQLDMLKMMLTTLMNQRDG